MHIKSILRWVIVALALAVTFSLYAQWDLLTNWVNAKLC
jgi:hypothetical protein